MGAYDSRRRVPIKQVYKSLVELQRFSTFRMFRMVGAVTVTTILACVLRLLFNDQEPFSFRIADMLGNDFNHTFQLGEETTSPVDFITAIWGVVVTICLGVAFQNEHYVSDRDAIGDFSGLLMCSSLATAFITGFWLPEMYHTNGAAKTAIITGAGCLLMGWILNYGSQIYITHRTMTHNERARNVDLRQYLQMRALRTRGRWPVWAVAVCAVNALFWLALAGMGGQMGRLRDGGWAAVALFAAALLATVMVLLYAYVRQRFVKAIASRMWGAAAAAVLAVVELVVLWYAGVLLWVAFTGAQAVRPWVVEAIAVWSLVNVAAARFVICRLAIHPTRALFRDAQFTQKTMQWQHYDLFAQLVDSSTIAQHDLSEYGMNLRLMTVPWRVVHEVLEAGESAVELVPEWAAMFFPQAEEQGVPLVAFTSSELRALICAVRRRHDWRDTAKMNVRALKELVRCADCEQEIVEETLCFYLAIMCDDVSYVVSLRRS